MTDKFNWDDFDDDLAVREQRAIVIYDNPKGDTVIRQAADHTPDEDSVVIVNRYNLAAFVGALQRHLENQQQRDSALPRNAN